MWDFLCFRRMLTPIIIEFIFWVVTAYCVFLGVYNIARHGDVIQWLEVLILGPIIARILTETLILFFRINETLTDIKHNTDNLPLEGLDNRPLEQVEVITPPVDLPPIEPPTKR